MSKFQIETERDSMQDKEKVVLHAYMPQTDTKKEVGPYF